MLMPLKKIAQEIGVQESEAHRLAIYAGLRRESGCYVAKIRQREIDGTCPVIRASSTGRCNTI
jgi:hypothetical protein